MRIREILDEQGITTKELAERMQPAITVSALNQNISGNPSKKVMERIATALNVPMWQLFASPSEVAGNNFAALVNNNGVFYAASSLSELEEIVKKIKGFNV